MKYKIYVVYPDPLKLIPIRWKDQIKEALSSIGITNWRRRARSRDAWKDVLRQAEIR